MGCGRSERTSPEVEEYSIAASVHDLLEVVEALMAKRLIPMQQGQPGVSPLRPVVARRHPGL